MPGSRLTNIEAARRLVKIARSFDHPYIKEPEVCVTAEAIKDFLDRKINKIFGTEGPFVEISEKILSKATASATQARYLF